MKQWHITTVERPASDAPNKSRYVSWAAGKETQAIAVLHGHGQDTKCVEIICRRLPELLSEAGPFHIAKPLLRETFKQLGEETAECASQASYSLALLYPGGAILTATLGNAPAIIYLKNGERLINPERRSLDSLDSGSTILREPEMQRTTKPITLVLLANSGFLNTADPEFHYQVSALLRYAKKGAPALLAQRLKLPLKNDAAIVVARFE